MERRGDLKLTITKLSPDFTIDDRTIGRAAERLYVIPDLVVPAIWSASLAAPSPYFTES